MKVLNGSELSGYIKERQAKQVRALRQAEGIQPKLAIIKTIDDPVIASYVGKKKAYGADILIEVDIYDVSSDQLFDTIKKLNADDTVHGIIVQLPLSDMSQTEEAVNLVASEKDVDGLSSGATLVPATPMAIDWLLAGYNVDLKDKKIAIVGRGRLVGAPLEKLWLAAGHDVEVFDKQSTNTFERLPHMDVIVTATGVPGLIKSEHIKQGAAVVDAATASEKGKIVGDVADDVRENRDDIAITPVKGGVGPLTVCALFDNVIRAARNQAELKND
ncbi:MAG TPA: bifunctional 5,10-methylenetetrahydrofolate dehydrogenase/5,10-methenyltetrahydrofolate cyclohydrolase [Candidatus Saccharimonadales bacterium]